MSGQLITIAASGGRSIEADLNVPAAGSGPGLILLQDAADNNRDLSDLGDLYAEEGYVVLCPRGVGIAQGAEDTATAAAALRSRPECTGKVGTLGFGRGGKLAYLAAAEAGVDCAVSYYGLDAVETENVAPESVEQPCKGHGRGVRRNERRDPQGNQPPYVQVGFVGELMTCIGNKLSFGVGVFAWCRSR